MCFSKTSAELKAKSLDPRLRGDDEPRQRRPVPAYAGMTSQGKGGLSPPTRGWRARAKAASPAFAGMSTKGKGGLSPLSRYDAVEAMAYRLPKPMAHSPHFAYSAPRFAHG